MELRPIIRQRPSRQLMVPRITLSTRASACSTPSAPTTSTLPNVTVINPDAIGEIACAFVRFFASFQELAKRVDVVVGYYRFSARVQALSDA